MPTTGHFGQILSLQNHEKGTFPPTYGILLLEHPVQTSTLLRLHPLLKERASHFPPVVLLEVVRISFTHTHFLDKLTNPENNHLKVLTLGTLK